MDWIQLLQGKGTGAGFSEHGLESKGRKFLDKFGDYLPSVKVMYDRKFYSCLAVRFKYSALCLSFPFSRHL